MLIVFADCHAAEYVCLMSLLGVLKCSVSLFCLSLRWLSWRH